MSMLEPLSSCLHLLTMIHTNQVDTFNSTRLQSTITLRFTLPIYVNKSLFGKNRKVY